MEMTAVKAADQPILLPMIVISAWPQKSWSKHLQSPVVSALPVASLILS